jgi:predicted metal-dependent hydrolase
LTVPPLKYLTGYPEPLLLQARKLLEQDKLGAALLARYPAGAHGVRTDRALYQYVTDLKNTYMRNGDQINKVAFDSKIHVIQHALGQHTYVSRVQGGKLKAKHEIRVATLFKTVPAEFLAHLKEKDHNRAFYNLCLHMEPQYHQYEFDLRLYLTHLEATNVALWKAAA